MYNCDIIPSVLQLKYVFLETYLKRLEHVGYENIKKINVPVCIRHESVCALCRQSSNGQRRLQWIVHIAIRLDGADQGPTSAYTTFNALLANWGPAEDVGNHNQGRLATPFSTLQVFVYARSGKNRANVSSGLAQDKKSNVEANFS